MRWNLSLGVSDFLINVVISLLSRAGLIALCIMPITVQMMKVCPKNIEASMFAVVTSIISISSDWGGELVGGTVLNILGVT